MFGLSLFEELIGIAESLVAPGNTRLHVVTHLLESQKRAKNIWLNISKLVDNQELVSGELPLQAKQPLLVASLQQFMVFSVGKQKRRTPAAKK